MTVHFISGLPRAGSTLLAGLLNQNPEFKANIISPVAGVVGAVLQQMSMAHETGVYATDGLRWSVARAVFEVFHERDDYGVSFDTHRSWCAKLPLINSLFPEAKVICCVREVPWIFDSIERLVRKNCLQPSSLFNFKQDGTVYSRMEMLAGTNGLVGYAVNALREACYGEHSDRIMLLRYETLTRNPRSAMKAVYEFIGQEFYEHDFDKVELDAELFDLIAGTPGLHQLKPRVKAEARNTILPPDLFKRFQNLTFWEHDGLPEILIK